MPHGRSKDSRVKLFSVVSSDRMRGNGHKPNSKKFHLNIRGKKKKKLVIKDCKRLHRETVKPTSLEVDMALRNLLSFTALV